MTVRQFLSLIGLGLRAFAGDARGDELSFRVGRLELPTGNVCIATLIEPDLALTAAHCLLNKSGGLSPPAAVGLRLSPAPEGKPEVEVRRGVALALHPAFPLDRIAHTTGIAADLAMIRVRPREPALFGRELRLAQVPRVDDPVVVVRPGGRQQPCSVISGAGALMALDCHVGLGDSGAPVFLRTAAGLALVGLVSARIRGGSQGNAAVVMAPQELDRLRRALAIQGM